MVASFFWAYIMENQEYLNCEIHGVTKHINQIAITCCHLENIGTPNDAKFDYVLAHYFCFGTPCISKRRTIKN